MFFFLSVWGKVNLSNAKIMAFFVCLFLTQWILGAWTLSKLQILAFLFGTSRINKFYHIDEILKSGAWVWWWLRPLESFPTWDILLFYAKPATFQEAFEESSQTQGGFCFVFSFLDNLVWNQEMVLMIFVYPFHLWIFCDSKYLGLCISSISHSLTIGFYVL